MNIRTRLALSLAALFASVGCDELANLGNDCTAGTNVACVCPGGGTGLALCNILGEPGECVCSVADVGIDTGLDAGTDSSPADTGRTDTGADVVDSGDTSDAGGTDTNTDDVADDVADTGGGDGAYVAIAVVSTAYLEGTLDNDSPGPDIDAIRVLRAGGTTSYVESVEVFDEGARGARTGNDYIDPSALFDADVVVDGVCDLDVTPGWLSLGGRGGFVVAATDSTFDVGDTIEVLELDGAYCSEIRTARADTFEVFVAPSSVSSADLADTTLADLSGWCWLGASDELGGVLSVDVTGDCPQRFGSVAVVSTADGADALDNSNPGPDLDAITVSRPSRRGPPAVSSPTAVESSEVGTLGRDDENTRTNFDGVLLQDVVVAGECDLDVTPGYVALGGDGGFVSVQFGSSFGDGDTIDVYEIDAEYCDLVSVDRPDTFDVYVAPFGADVFALDNLESWCLIGSSGAEGGPASIVLDLDTCR